MHAWGETAVRFQLTDTPAGGTLVRFWHQLGPELSEDALGSANLNWGHYLDSFAHTL